jgi:membrane complex biogenesis BtpA family protein
VNVHTGSAVTDQGLIHGKAHETLRLRENLKSGVLIFADVDVKHASPLGNRGIEAETRDLTNRGLADAIIVSGEGTGLPTRSTDIEKVRENTNLPVLLGSGVKPNNIKTLSGISDGFIVGSYFKKDGKAMSTVEDERVKSFMEKYNALH